MLFVLSTFVSLPCLSRFNGTPQDWQFLKARFDSIQSTPIKERPILKASYFWLAHSASSSMMRSPARNVLSSWSRSGL